MNLINACPRLVAQCPGVNVWGCVWECVWYGCTQVALSSSSAFAETLISHFYFSLEAHWGFILKVAVLGTSKSTVKLHASVEELTEFRKVVTIMVMDYYSERIQIKIRKGKRCLW